MQGIQFRMSANDERFFAYNRDYAHCMPAVMKMVADRLELGPSWEALDRYLAANHITQDELGEGCGAFIDIWGGAGRIAGESFEASCERAGWNKIRSAVQVAIFAHFGEVFSAMILTGFLDATIDGKGPAAQIHENEWRIKLAARAMARSWGQNLGIQLRHLVRAVMLPILRLWPESKGK